MVGDNPAVERKGNKAKVAFLREVGLRLRTIRKQRGLTQAQTAEAAKFSTQYVSELERGVRPDVPLDTLRRVVEDGLGASLADVFTNDAPPAPDTRPLPPDVDAVARQLARLSSARRRRVMILLKAAFKATA